MGRPMALKTLDQYQQQKAQSLASYQRRQTAGVKSLSDYQQQQKQEISDERLDPYLGRPVGYRLSEVGIPAAPAPEGLFLDEAGKQFLDDVMDPMYFGRATGRHFERDADDKLKAYYSMKLNLPPAWIDRHSDTITEALLGEKLPAKTAGERIAQNWRNGQIQVQRSDLALQVLMGTDTADTWRQIQTLQKAYSEDPRATFRPWWEKMLSATAEILPYSVEGIKASPVGASVGAVAGAGAALTLGQLGPQALAPEESVTVPAMIWSGVKLGGGLATAYRIGQLEAGGALLDLLEMGIDPAIAKAACVGVGALNGALEIAQISTLLKTLPGGRKIAATTVRQVVSRLVKENTFRNLATRHVAEFGVYLSAETLQELAQESVNVTAEQFSAVLHEQLKGQNIDTQTIDEIVARFREVGAKSLQGFTVLGIPGSALSAAVGAGETVVMRGAPSMLPNLQETLVKVPAPAVEKFDPENLPIGVPGVQSRTAPSVAEAQTLAAKGLEAAQPLAETRPGQTTATEAETGPTEVEARRQTPTANLEAALDQLSMEALVERAKRIGVTVKGKKAQLAALIAETIRAKVAGRQTKTERQALQETERQIAEHPLYREYDERMAATEGIKIDPDTTYYVEPKYKGDVEGYIGKAGSKDYNAAVGRRITFDKAKGQAWDDAVQEQGFDFSFDQFMENLIGSISGVRAARTAGVNETALAEALRSNEPALIMLDKKRQMLREQRSVWEINQALHGIAADYKLDLGDYQELLIGSDMASPAGEVHPGSLSFTDFFEQLGRELVDEQSPWLRRWTIPAVPEKPREMWNRLRSEWQAIKAHEIAGELNIEQAAEAGRKLTAEQEAELGKLDAEKVAEDILKKHKDTLVGKLIGSMFDDAVEIRQLREALAKAYRAGTKQGIAEAREAYRQGQQRVKARRQLREYVAKLLRIIKKPVGRTVAFSQRLAVQMIQQQIDPKFRRLDTIEKRRQSREFFEKHPEAEAPRKTIALIESVAPNELTVAQLETIAKEVSELKRKGRLLRKAEVEARAVQAKADHDAVVGALTGGEAPVQTIEPVVAPPVITLRQKLRDLFRLTLTPERVLDWYDGRKLFHGPIFRLFFERVADAENSKLRRIQQRVESARQALAGVGMTLADLQQAMFAFEGKALTVQDCLGIYLFRMNPMSKLAVTFGNWISDEVQKRVADLVEADPRLVNLAQYILQHYEDHYARVREAVIVTEDRDMGKEDNYTPMRRMERDYTPDERSILTEMMQREHYKRGVAEKGFTLARQDIDAEYQKPIRLDAWTLLLEQIERQEHYIAFAELTKRLRAIVSSEAVQTALRQKHSPQAVRWLREYVDVVANPNIYKTWSQAENLARTIRRHTAVAFLAWKLSTALKQGVSLVRYMPEAGHHLLKAGLEAATDWQRVREFVTSRDPMVEFAALERELEEIKAARPDAYRDMVRRFGEIGLKGLVWFDAPARTIGWYGVYLAEHERAVAEGLDAPEADRRATKAAQSATSRTQAGARAFQLPELYRSGEVYNLLLQFTNEMNKLWNIVSYDLPSLVRNQQYSRAAMMFAAVGLEAGLIWTITHRRPPEDEDDLKDIALEQIVSLIPVVGNNIVAIERGFGSGTDVAALSGGAEFASNAYKAMEGMLAGEVDAKALEAAYRGIAPVVGLPYTGPQNLIEFGLTGNPYYLVGGLPTGQQKNPKSKAAVQARRKRK